MGLLIVLVLRAAPSAEGAEAISAGTTRYTLDECIGFALRHQEAIAAQRAAVGAAVERKRIAESYYLPQVGLTARYANLDEPRTVDLPTPFAGGVGDVFSDAAAYFGLARAYGTTFADAALNQPNLPPFSVAKQQALDALPDRLSVGLLGENSLTTEFLAVQPIWTGGKITYRNQQAELGVQAASADLAKSRQQTVFDVTHAYLGAQLAGALTNTADAAIGHFLAIESLVTSLLEEGNEYITTVDLHRVRALRLLAEADRTGLVQARALAHAALHQAMGLDAGAEFEIAESSLSLQQESIELARVLDQAMLQRPEIAKTRIAMQIAELERKLARASYAPDLGAFGRLTTIDDDGGFANPNDREEWAVGVTLETPLYLGGRRMAKVREADWSQSQACYISRLVRSLIRLEVQKAYLEYVELTERIPLASAATTAAAGALDGYRNQFALGAIADADMPRYFEDLAEARVLYTQARTRYDDTVYRYNLCLARIRFVTASHEYQSLVDGDSVGMATASDRPDSVVGR